MGRRANILPDETLSQEKPKVQEKLLDEIIKADDNQDNQDKNVENITNDIDNLSNDKKIDIKIKPGDTVKLNDDVKFDALGRRIHNGLRNYVYRVLSVRVDDMLVIECLTHCFTIAPNDVHKI